jgi:hypothetical protein
MKTHYGFLVLCSALFLSACAPETVDSEEQRVRFFGPAEFDIGQCSNDPEVGESIEAPITFGAPQNTAYFGKRFYTQSLEKTLQASSFSIAKALFDEGVDLYQVPSYVPSRCRYFDFLNPTISVATVQESWNQSVKLAPSQNALLGLFATKYRKNLQSGHVTLRYPSIVLLDRTQKWTLIHEMSHYLFARARILSPHMPFNEDLNNRNRLVRSQINSLRDISRLDQNQAQLLVTLYEDYIAFNLELDKREALEEFTIEAMILEYYREGKISGVENTTDAHNAYQYMKDNSKTIIRSYQSIVDEMEEEKNAQLIDHPTLVTKIETLQKDLQEMLSFIQIKLDWAQGPQSPSIFRTRPRPDSTENHPHEHIHTQHYDLEAFKERHRLLQGDSP